MMNQSKIGMALVGGYLLGRTKKAKLAIGLGMFLAGKKLNLNPQQLAKMVANSPVVGQLGEQVRKDLVDGTKSALTSAVTQRAGHFADSLHERTLGMNDPEGRAGSSEDGDAAEDEGDDRAERDERDERDEPEKRQSRSEERPRPRRKSPASGAKSAGTAKSTGSSTGKAAAGKAAPRKAASGSRENGSGGARKTAGGARKTAAKSTSGTARKTSTRGGRNG